MTFCSISDSICISFHKCVSLRQIDASFRGEPISPPDSRRGYCARRNCQAHTGGRIGVTVGSAVAGGLTGGLLGGLVGTATGAPVAVTAPIGAALGATTAGVVAHRRFWYGGKRGSTPPTDDQWARSKMDSISNPVFGLSKFSSGLFSFIMNLSCIRSIDTYLC